MLSDNGPKIILLDLNNTLSANMRQVMGARGTSFGRKVRTIEQYRLWLIEWLKHSTWQVHLFTVRNVRYSIDTLESIEEKTGWRPDEAWFNDTEYTGQHAPLVKQILLKRVFARHQPSAVYAFESNGATREMLDGYNIPCQRIDGPEDLPDLSDFYDGPEPVPTPDLTGATLDLPAQDKPNRQMRLS